MLRDLRVKICVLALALTSAAVIVAHAQIVAPPGPTLPPGFCTGGPFTVNGGEVKFHVALDDHPRTPSMRVILRLYDSAGSIVAQRTVTLAAGTTATLEFRGAGLLRAQATFDSILNPSARRGAVGSVELFDVDNFRAVIPVMCVPNDPIIR